MWTDKILLCLFRTVLDVWDHVYFSVVTIILLISQCSVSCGEGVARRLVTCRIGDQCTGEKPESHRPCRPGSCHGKMTQTHHYKFCNPRQEIGFNKKRFSTGMKMCDLWGRFYGVLNGWTVHVVLSTKESILKENRKYCTMNKFICIDDIIHGALNHSAFPRMLLWSMNFSTALWWSVFTPSHLSVESFYLDKHFTCEKAFN